MGSGADWAVAISVLDERFFCVAPDLPGHGSSLGLPYPEAYTMEGAAQALLDLLDELEIQSPAIVGYSMGGRLALYLALRYPGKCSALFLESASPGIEEAAERGARRDADEELAKRLESKDFGGFLEDWYRQPLFASLTRREGLIEEMMVLRRRNEPGELARSLRGMGAGSQPSLWGELGGLRAPTLAVAGALDQRYVRIANRMASVSPSIRVAVIPGAGHNVHLEALDAYLDLLNSFARSHYNLSS